MNIVVQKFGGTSVASQEARKSCFSHIKQALSDGSKVVVVVSAMGRKGAPYATDSLLSLVSHLPRRDSDLLVSTGELISAAVFASELRELEGIDNTVLTGGQAGIITNNDYSNAKIIDLQPERILRELNNNKVVIVTGFQGITANGEVTTLGRGGSDTSATALGVALNARFVDIFTDVEGIMTADPRIVEDASILEKTTYTEICNMAYQGAKVIHPRAVEIAMQQNIPIRVRSTFSTSAGTLVTTINEISHSSDKSLERALTGITQTSNVSQIKVYCRDGESYQLQNDVFQSMEMNDISVDFININPDHIVYTVFHSELAKTKNILDDLGYPYEAIEECAKVSLVGAGMAGVPGVMARIVECLTSQNIQILQSADSHTTIWVLVKQGDMVNAVRSLHAKFELNRIM